MSALRVAVIGVGWAGERHLEAYEAHPDVELVGLAGLEEDMRQALAAQYGIERHVAAWEDLLELDGIDAVSVCVPTFLHAPIAIAALERGIHVLSEKPMALNGEEAQAMVAAARAANRVLDVGFNHRQRGDIQKLAEVVGAGPARARLLREGVVAAAHRHPEARELVHRLRAGGRRPARGHRRPRARLRAVVLGSPSVTAVSASTYDLLGSSGFGYSPTSTKTGEDASFDVEDLATAFMRLDDGGTLLVEASWAAHRSDGDEFGITLYGTEGGAELIVDDYEPSGSLRLFTDDGGVPAETRLTAEPGRGHMAVIEQFVAKVRSGGWDAHDGAAAVQLARIVDACYLSAEEQAEVRLDADRVQ